MPQKDSSSFLSLGENSTNPHTYIIAQNAEVLAQLMRENECRPFNPSAYNTPATVFNTLGVQIDVSKSEPVTHEMPTLPLKTVMLPASELQKLNPVIDDNSHTKNTFATNTTDEHSHLTFTPEIQLQNQNVQDNSQTPPAYPIPCEIINTATQQVHIIDQKYKAQQATNMSQNILLSSTLCTDLVQKSRSLDRNMPSNATKICSLDRFQNLCQMKTSRSNSLTRQLSFGNEMSNVNTVGNFMANTRSASLERGTHIGFRTISLECGNNKQLYSQNISYMRNDNEHEVNFDENQSISNSYNKINTHNYSLGSLDRNHQGTIMYHLFQ